MIRKKSRTYARECIAYGKDFFFGDWRRKVPTDEGNYDSHWWRSNWTWIQQYRDSSCWAAVVGDWESVERISDYPGDDCTVDVGLKREDKAMYLAVAAFIRDETGGKIDSYLAAMASGKKEKPKFVARVLHALASEDSAKFQLEFEDYLAFFARREFRRSSMDRIIAFDGTLLYHLAIREGFKCSIPPGCEDFIIEGEATSFL